MSKFIINGGKILNGEITVKGAKNSALKIIAGSILSDQKITIKNVPNIPEIRCILNLIEYIGGNVFYDQESEIVEIQVEQIKTTDLPEELVRKSRSSVLIVGPLLVRTGFVRFPHPGGCALGQRPIDFFLNGFKKFGAKVKVNNGFYEISVEKDLQGTEFYFPRISHTGTESLMMTASLIKGRTILQNCACEPEVVALADYLNKQGARIQGAGTPTIVIDGVEKINAGIFETIPDRLEAGTFAILGALTAEKLKVNNCEPKHLRSLWYFFDKVGVEYELGENYILVNNSNIQNYKAVNVQTHEYPGFATDLQPPFTVLLTQCKGLSLVHETIFDGRLFYTDFLKQMGAEIIMCDPHRVIVNGPSILKGRKITSPDIRAGMALVLAALIAQGQSEIDNIYQIDRGYSKIEERLENIGASIKRIE